MRTPSNLGSSYFVNIKNLLQGRKDQSVEFKKNERNWRDSSNTTLVSKAVNSLKPLTKQRQSMSISDRITSFWKRRSTQSTSDSKKKQEKLP